MSLTRPFELSLGKTWVSIVHNSINRPMKNLIFSMRDKRIKMFI